MSLAHKPGLWRTLWTNAAFAPRTSLGFMRIDYVLGTVLIVPFTQMVFFAVVAQLAGNASAPVAYVVLGNAIAPVTYSSIFSVCQTTDSEKHQGTMEHLLVTAANRAALYLGRGMLPIATSMATLTVGLLYAAFVFHVPFAAGSILPIAVSVVLLSVSMVGFGLLLGGVALFLRTSIILGNIFLFIGLLLSGANFPVSFLPLPLQWLGYLLPLTWGISAVRAAASGAALGTMLPLWGVLALSTVVAIGL
ncbi:MAG: ABC transporter permease, partial [Thermoplasmata archaeon]|nr:ABC transporter permease [Thermoplasmata archaeon]